MINEKLAIQFAQEIVEQEKRINALIKNDKLAFDVREEGGVAYIQTAICNVGGCVADFLTFDSLAEAKRQAAIMTITGEEMRTVGICSECMNEEEDEIYCLQCGKELLPVYEEYPNWIKFCRECDI